MVEEQRNKIEQLFKKIEEKDLLEITETYQLTNGETLCKFNDGQYTKTFENVLVECINSNTIAISSNSLMGSELQKIQNYFLCQDIAFEGRIHIHDPNYLFTKHYTQCKSLTIFFTGIIIINNYSYLCIKVINKNI